MPSEIDHEWTDVPVCPHCGERDDDWWDGLGHKDDGDEWPMDCGACDGAYVVTMSVSVDFITKTKEPPDAQR